MEEIPEALRTALRGTYDLHHVVGHGGMATVYLARDVRHGRDVAVKVLRAEVAASLGTDRFLREIEIAARLTHPHILALFDSGKAASTTRHGTDEFLYYVMPYIDGESLRAHLTRERALAPSDALPIVREMADALGYAHRQGIIHRDIKPENVLLTSGHAIVADFGIAKALSSAGGKNLTRTGFPIGTVGYMSPEQAAGSTDLDATTDIFSLACVCYEMLVGEVPGKWVSDADTQRGRFLEAPLAHRVKLDALPAEIEPTLVRAMAMRPRDRFRSPQEFAACLTGARPADLPAPAARAGLDEGMSITAVERVAAEAGIAPEHVRAAARAVEASDPPPQPTLFGGTSHPLVFERTVSGEVADEDLPTLVEHIREATGYAGLVSTLGRSLEWRSMEQAFSGRLFDPSRGPAATRDVSVTITPRDGRTRIRVEEQMQRTRLMSLAMSTAGLVPAVLLAGLFSAEAASGWAGVSVIAGLGTVAFGGALAYVRRLSRKRSTQARALADRLAHEVATSPRTR